MTVHYDFVVTTAEGRDVLLDHVSDEALHSSIADTIKRSDAEVGALSDRLRRRAAARAAVRAAGDPGRPC